MAAFIECATEGGVSEAVKTMDYSRLIAKQEEVVKVFVRGEDVFVRLVAGRASVTAFCPSYLTY